MELFAAVPRYNPYLDLNSFARFALAAKKLGHLHHRRRRPAQLGAGGRALRRHHEPPPRPRACTPPRYTYAVRICPEPAHWGGLSGCTYSEGVSWGKFVPRSEGGRFAEVYADATTVWPLLIKGVLEELGLS